MAWELLSGRHDALLDDLVVYIVPASNPDSHERFAAWFKATARWPDGDPDPNAVEHRAPWGLSTNNNHYQINLNRDSVWSTQPENRALVRLYLDTRPMVFVDHHGETDSFIGPVDGRAAPHRAHREPARLARGVRPGDGGRLRFGGLPLRAVGVRPVRPGLLGHPAELHGLDRLHAGDDRRRLARVAHRPSGRRRIHAARRQSSST